MLMHDLKLIEKNCAYFNGEDNMIAKHAKQLYENLKKIFDKVLTYKLRSVSYFKFLNLILYYRYHVEALVIEIWVYLIIMKIQESHY